MDEQEKELEEILRTFDKAPSPSSERNNQAQMRQNHLQSRQAPKKTTDAERTARTSNQTAYKRQPQSSKGRYLSPKRKAAIKRRKRQRAVIVSLLALLFVVLIIVLICKGCSGRTDALAGKWDFDGTTAYEFDGKGVGTMVLPSVSYDFKYEINGNELYIWYNISCFESKEHYQKAITEIKDRSLYDTGIEPQFKEQLLTLSTCFGDSKDSRIVVIGVEQIR